MDYLWLNHDVFMGLSSQMTVCSLIHSSPFSSNGRVKRKAHERLQYLRRQIFAEMGLSQVQSLEFWSMVVVFILCWWIRLYLHYIAQYAFLRLSNIPVIR